METSTERLLALANAAAPHGALLVDDRGLIILANPAVTRTLGWAEEELIGKPVEMLIPVRFRVVHDQNRRRYQREPGAREMGVGRELFARCKNGDEIPVEVGLNPIETEEGAFTLATVVDQSVRNEMAARMIAAERLASLGTLAASVAHEVNNPNAFITANLEALRDALGLIEQVLAGDPEQMERCRAALDEAQETIDDSLEGVRRITAIVSRLRVLTRSPSAEDPAGRVCLNEVVRWASMMTQGQVIERATLELNLSDSLPRTAGYSGQLSQVVTNLLTNAAQAIPEGEPARHRVTVSTAHHDGRLRLCVEDTGQGVDADTREEAFRRFFTTKPVGVGFGLGLTISREIVESHGGRIWLEARGEGHPGTRAVVELPIRDGSAQPPGAMADSDGVAVPLSRILVVDDDFSIRRAYQRALAPHAVEGTDGVGAWQRFEEGDRQYDMVLCDVTMPVLDGATLHNRVSRQWPRLASRFVFSTGGAVSPRARELLDSIDNLILYKPVPREALLDALSKLRETDSDAAQ